MLDIPNELEAQWLIGQGVPDTAMLGTPCLRAGRVRFLENETFEFVDDGDRALIFRVVDCEYEIDLVAWSHRQDKLATNRGVAFALGQDSITNPGTFFDGGTLQVHPTPLEWLRADREGICIVQSRFTYSQLHNVKRLQFADKVHAKRVNLWIQPPKTRAELLVEVAA